MRYFKGKQFKIDINLVAFGYYCRFFLSYRDVSENLKEYDLFRSSLNNYALGSYIWKINPSNLEEENKKHLPVLENR